MSVGDHSSLRVDQQWSRREKKGPKLWLPRISKHYTVSTKPLARRTLGVPSLRCWSANELARCRDSSYHLVAACSNAFIC
jgi:hypothetical protein